MPLSDFVTGLADRQRSEGVMPDIVFTIRLTDADWDDTIRGWRCPALNVPGAVIDAIYLEGNRVDTARYEALPAQAFIRWLFPDRPQQASVAIKLTQELTLGSETDRWKRRAIVLPALATVGAAALTGAATYFSRAPAVHVAAVDAPPVVHQPSKAQELSNDVNAVGSSGEAVVDVIGKENTNISNALAISLGTTYKSRFQDDGSSLYFSFRQQNAHDLLVELTLLSSTAQVRPVLAIYDEHNEKQFSRWHESKDGSRITWTVPVTSGYYYIEVKPDYTSGDYTQFSLLLTPAN
jgi:hypothetical protein